MKARAITAQTRVEMLLTVRRAESLLVTLAIPLGILVFFTKVDAVNTTLQDPVDFLVPGVLALAVMSSAMVSLGIATGYERRYGVLKRLGSTPFTRAGLLAAKTLNVLALEVVQTVAIVVTGLALGWHVSGGLIAAVGLLLLGTIAFAGIGMLLAGTLRAEANLAVANGLFLVLALPGRDGVPAPQAARRARDVRQGTPRGRALGDAARRPRSRRVVPDRRARRARDLGHRRPARRRPLVPLGGVAAPRRRRPRRAHAAVPSGDADLGQLALELGFRESTDHVGRDRAVGAG